MSQIGIEGKIKAASGYVTIRGSLIAEDKDVLTVRGKYSLLEIPTKAIHEKQEITSETEGKILIIKVDPEAKILQSISRSASEVTGTTDSSLFGKGNRPGIDETGDCRCECACTDCNCDCNCDCDCKCECACDIQSAGRQGSEMRRTFRKSFRRPNC